MNSSFYKREIVLICTFVLFLILTSKVYPETYELRVFNKTENKLLFSSVVYLGQTFSLEYTHSVQLTPVRETFTIDSTGSIILIETSFESTGFGLPEPKGNFKFKDGKIIWSNINRRIGTIFLRVGFFRSFLFIYKKRKIDFRQVAKGGNLIEIKCEIK